MRAAVTTGDPQRPVTLEERPAPVPSAGEALVRVVATSLNAGEVRRASRAPAGQRIGWDIAGFIEVPAADGSGPAKGTRVVTFVDNVGWAELVAVGARQLGTIPPDVGFDDAATLPVAGLTALRGLARRGTLLERRVLVAPGTGGVGLFAVQLAHLQGAHVTAVVRNRDDAALLGRIGADEVVIGTTREAASGQKFDVILESLGGDSLAAAMGAVAPDGVVVSFGQTLSAETTFNSSAFYATGGASLYGFYLFHEAERVPVGPDLERLAALVGEKKLETHIDLKFRYDELEQAVEALRERRVTGKVIVRFSP